MSELSDLLGGLLGNEAGKDSGGNGRLIRSAGRTDAVRPSTERVATARNFGCEGPGCSGLYKSCILFPSCRTMIRISGCCERFSRISLRNGLPGQRMSSRSCGWQTYCRCCVFPAARKKKQPTKRSDDHGSLEQRRAFPAGISPHAGKCPTPAAGIGQKAAGLSKRRRKFAAGFGYNFQKGKYALGTSTGAAGDATRTDQAGRR